MDLQLEGDTHRESIKSANDLQNIKVLFSNSKKPKSKKQVLKKSSSKKEKLNSKKKRLGEPSNLSNPKKLVKKRFTNPLADEYWNLNTTQKQNSKREFVSNYLHLEKSKNSLSNNASISSMGKYSQKNDFAPRLKKFEPVKHKKIHHKESTALTERAKEPVKEAF